MLLAHTVRRHKGNNLSTFLARRYETTRAVTFFAFWQKIYLTIGLYIRV